MQCNRCKSEITEADLAEDPCLLRDDPKNEGKMACDACLEYDWYGPADAAYQGWCDEQR